MARGRKAEKRIDAIPPTREQELQAEYRLEPITEHGQVIGTAYRRRAMIDILHERGILDEPLYKALKHYRHHADIADKSPIRDILMPDGTVETIDQDFETIGEWAEYQDSKRGGTS